MLSSTPHHSPRCSLHQESPPSRVSDASAFIVSLPHQPSRGRAAQVEQPRSTRTFTLMAPSGSGPSRTWIDTDAGPRGQRLRRQCWRLASPVGAFLLFVSVSRLESSVPTPSPAISRLRLTAFDHFIVVHTPPRTGRSPTHWRRDSSLFPVNCSRLFTRIVLDWTRRMTRSR